MSTTRETTGRRSGDVARHETSSLISSDKVEGTSVYDIQGNDLGTIHSVMIGKVDGKVAYAVLSFGGFLGIGTNYYPVPWKALKYDTHMGGYVTGMTKEQFQGAPSYDPATDWYSRSAGWPADVDRYYGRPGMWTH
ncbi:PRC-barrel domain-containing protein [Plastoroseomonas hellenica]|uniref:PRC-barrel domain containing protein n=1 Tax=Plastoroseomonas hellenica TaxID=2687306 RepID=A0ABS5F148_9PROT|nr:PRC-barrel domain-containing protein [Plastoroseomonas hellenica]MBR0646137.1 PRC-barrel domain containing protein [Plastoroseomonas hellenica]MBR0666274.1 PRC-barrel domain containing protein [Plastoroseomonas hellenica]